MLSGSTHLPLLQLPWHECGQLLFVIGISFALITLICSVARFQHIIQVDENELLSAENQTDFFFIQIIRYLSRIGRASSDFIVFIAQIHTPPDNQDSACEQLRQRLQQIIRTNSDHACLYRADCIAAVIDTGHETAPLALQRITSELARQANALPAAPTIHVGAALFPLHGLNTQPLIDAACGALEQTDSCTDAPFCIAPSPTAASLSTDEEPDTLDRDEKNSALDPLTGVLKPEVIHSYMRKYLTTLRIKKTPATLLCIHINRIDPLIELQGELAAEEVIACVSQTITALTREADLIGRYQREDFALLSPCPIEQGQEIARRLKEAIQKQVIRYHGRPIKTSISIGIAAHPQHGRNFRTLFRGAYAALETIREWNTSSCLIFDPAKHNIKENHAPSA